MKHHAQKHLGEERVPQSSPPSRKPGQQLKAELMPRPCLAAQFAQPVSSTPQEHQPRGGTTLSGMGLSQASLGGGIFSVGSLFPHGSSYGRVNEALAAERLSSNGAILSE